MRFFTRSLLRCAALCVLLFTLSFLTLADGASAASPCGSWTLVPTPNPSPERNLLRGVSAVSAGDVWAVGEYTPTGDVQRTLVLHWDGFGWSVVPSPNAGTSGSVLEGVVGLSASDAWAVGYSSVYGEPQTLTLRWDGSVWSPVPSPAVQGGSDLWAVAAVSPDDIWAVGTRAGFGDGGATSVTLTVHWDGSDWTLVPSPNVANRSHRLWAVSASASDDVWAVGESRNVGGPYQALILHWDGSAWSVVPNPSPELDGGLEGVVALETDDVWAVGAFNDAGTLDVLFLHWDGATWTQVPSPGGGGGIAGTSSDDIWSVGSEIVHWDGTSWTLVNTPVTDDGTLASTGALAVLPGCDAWTVGRSITVDGKFVTLAERLNADVVGVRVPPVNPVTAALGAPRPNPTTRGA